MSEAAPPVHTYTWIKKSGAVEMKSGKENTLTFSKIRSEDSGEYLCRAANRIGQQNSSAVSVKVLYHPKNTTVKSSASGEITAGNPVTLTCMSEADPPVHTYTWIKKSGAVELKSGKDNTLTFSQISSEDSGEYLCRAANRIGKQDSPAVSVQVLYAPQNTTVLFSESGVIVKGTSVTLTCSSDANPPVESYTWFKVNESTAVGSGQQYSITNISSEDGGQYYCEARNKYGAENSTTVSITVTSWQSPLSTAVITVSVCGAVGLLCLVFLMSKKCKKNATQTREDRNTRDYDGARTPVIIIDPPGNIAEGSRVTLTCSSDANPPVESYTWFKVNESTAVGSGQQYSITNISSEDGGQYYCEARNKYGAENSTTVSITVTSWQSPLSTAVITVSVCGAVGLLCLVFLMR
ncbi:hypothetical protein AALO_G00094850 [Alosa alosa]|uniref:Ig-like domain-containing protein n=1 Tax=Alosa alosa TaxID=278164 RepID=A0AAV6GTH8_9TELE|nr:hypothetical protein AALO_G00094850 [Alosa alosa]